MEFTLHSSKARKRWKLLKTTILNKRNNPSSLLTSISSRRLANLDLFNIDANYSIEASSNILSISKYTRWSRILVSKTHSFLISEQCDAMTLDQLAGFDNTGVVCIWPAEQCMTYLVLEQVAPSLTSDSVVVEVGGGQTCLAGVALACTAACARVLLTDGNERAVQNLEQLVARNRREGCLRTESTECRVLRWDDPRTWTDLAGTCDLVLCADCFFFESGRPELARCLLRLLRPGRGRALLVAPRRSRTLDAFLDALVASSAFTSSASASPSSRSQSSGSAAAYNAINEAEGSQPPLPAVSMCRTYSLYALDSDSTRVRTPDSGAGSCTHSPSTSTPPLPPPPPTASSSEPTATATTMAIAAIGEEDREPIPAAEFSDSDSPSGHSPSPSRDGGPSSSNDSNATRACSFLTDHSSCSMHTAVTRPSLAVCESDKRCLRTPHCRSRTSSPENESAGRASLEEFARANGGHESEWPSPSPSPSPSRSQEASALRVCVHAEYDERIARLDRERRASPLYDPDIHSPLLVLISPAALAHSKDSKSCPLLSSA